MLPNVHLGSTIKYDIGLEALYDEHTIIYKLELSRTKAFVVNCGYQMHAVTLIKDTCKYYYDIWMMCVNYLKNNFMSAKTHIIVVLDDYDDPDSKGKSEQLRRYRHIFPVLHISESTLVYGI